MLIEYQSRHFSVIFGSDVQRNGVYLELAAAGTSNALLEVFYSDADGSFTLNTIGGHSVPLAVAEQFIAEAQRRLPASERAS